MKSSNNEKEKEKEKEASMNLNENSDDENKDEDNSSNEGEEIEKNEEKKNIQLFIHLTLITKLVKKENGEYPCICHNLSKEDILEDNNNNILLNNSNNLNNNNNNINSTSSFLEEEIIPNIDIPITSDKKIFMKDIISKLKYLGYPTTGALFSVFIKTAFEYVYFGSDPIDPNISLDETLVDFDHLKIKMVSYLEDKLIKKTEKQLFDKKETNKTQKEPKKEKLNSL